MRTMIVSIFLGILLGGLACANNDVEPSETRDYLVRLFSYANDHNIKALEEMRDGIKSRNDRTLNIGYSLALYIASPKKYKNEFVESFPTDHTGLMDNLFALMEAEGLTPSFMYSVEAIGKIAEGGNEQAIEKLFQGCLHTDAAVTVSFCEAIIRSFEMQTEKSLRIFSGLDEKQRRKIYPLCFEDGIISQEGFSSLRTKLRKLLPKVPAAEARVIHEIDEIKP